MYREMQTNWKEVAVAATIAVTWTDGVEGRGVEKPNKEHMNHSYTPAMVGWP